METKDVLTQVVQPLGQLLCNLADRWSDEHKYEDIGEYQTVIQGKLPAGVVVTKMSKRPFGFEFVHAGRVGFVKVGAKDISYGTKKL